MRGDFIKFNFLSIMLLCIIILTSCNQQKSSSDNSFPFLESQLDISFEFSDNTKPTNDIHLKLVENIHNKVIRQLNDPTRTMPLILDYIIYDDFDGNGYLEAFAVIENGGEFQIWFSSDEETKKLATSYKNLSKNEGLPFIITLDYQHKFMLFSEFVSPDLTKEYMFGVKDGKAYESNISQTMLEEGQFCDMFMVYTGYQVFSDGTGRCWIPYYFYWDEDGEFKEYGGIKIETEDFWSIKGSEELFYYNHQAPQTAEITEVYYRENGVINVNYIDDPNNEDYINCNVTFLYKEGHLSLLDLHIISGDVWDGHYFSSINEAYSNREISFTATYPTIFLE